MLAKRCFDLLFTLPALALLAPVFLAIALWIRFDSAGPIFFRQERVGRKGKIFRIYKFRTMVQDAEKKGRLITVGEDPRITKSGKFLRRYKVDELPQLLNVARGDMSLVGPRPEVPRYVQMYPLSIKNIVLSVPPGITDFASIEYKDENRILGESQDPELAYVNQVMPVKLALYEKYVSVRSLWVDFCLIVRTLKAILLD